MQPMLRQFFYALMVCGLSLPVTGAELVRQFTGKGATTTVAFEAEAPWILEWRVNSDYQKSMAIEIHLVDGITGFHKGLIAQTKFPNDGVRLFNESGSFRFRISATLSRWDLRVKELTAEEAERYSPRQ